MFSLVDGRGKEDDRSGSQASFKILVHRSAVGAVIGKSGAVIKETQQKTGAHAQAAKEDRVAV